MFGIDIPFVDDVLDAVEGGVHDAVNAVEDAANSAMHAIEGAVDAVIQVGGDVLDAVEDLIKKAGEGIGDALEWLGDKAKDVLDWLEKQAQQIAVALGNAVSAVIDGIDQAFSFIGEAIKDGAEFLERAVSSTVDWVGRNLEKAIDWIVEEALPFAWALIKIAGAVALLVMTWPIVLAAVFICTQVARVFGREYGTVLENIRRSAPRYGQMLKVLRLPARQKYFISSDLHYYAAGRMDNSSFSGHQRIKELYRRVLSWYVPNDFTLIENGDVEDYWLRGGSGYGVVFDAASVLPAPSLNHLFAEAGLLSAAQFHLGQVVNNNVDVYSFIRANFHDRGRYFRTLGNHDDLYADPQMVSALGRVYPGINVYDAIVLQADEDINGVAVITHGHQTDAWNMPGCSFLGKITTSLGSALRDLSFGEWTPGLPDASKTDKLWNWRNDNQDDRPNKLDQVSPWVGINTDLGSLDEEGLFGGYQRTYPSGGGPVVILGHTHAPLSQPHSSQGGRWDRYYNTGSAGMFANLVTGVEWDGTVDPRNPSIRTVAWQIDLSQDQQLLKRAFVGDSIVENRAIAV